MDDPSFDRWARLLSRRPRTTRRKVTGGLLGTVLASVLAGRDDAWSKKKSKSKNKKKSRVSVDAPDRRLLRHPHRRLHHRRPWVSPIHSAGTIQISRSAVLGGGRRPSFPIPPPASLALNVWWRPRQRATNLRWNCGRSLRQGRLPAMSSRRRRSWSKKMVKHNCLARSTKRCRSSPERAMRSRSR